MEETELLTVEDPGQVTQEYNRLYAIYESLCDKDSSPIDDVASILTFCNEDSSVATYKSWDLFNTRGRQRGISNSYMTRNYFDDDSERKSREIFIEALNTYIRKLESYRYGYNKIATLYSYLMYQGLYGLMTELYVPDYLRESVDEIVNTLNTKLDESIKTCKEYFFAKGNEKLNSIVNSLDRLLLAQRSDQVFNTLRKYDDSLNDDDLDYLRWMRDEYLKFQNNPQLNFAKEIFGLTDGSYYRNLNQIIADLVDVLDEDSLALLNELFL